MPYGHRFNHPAFHRRAEFVDAMRLNQFWSFASFVSGPCILSRSQYLPPASPSVVGYFYIDFGPSMRFPKGRDTASGDSPKAFETIPSFRTRCRTIHSFKVNIFQLGLTMANVIKDDPRPGRAPRTGSITGGIQPHHRPHLSEEIASTNLVWNHGALTYFAKNVASVFRKDYPPTRRYEGFGGTTYKEVFLRRFTCGLPDY
ncbi:hypothetical protein B0H14DRAFT_3736707 [Mycena olivaceomarginata]|nr:hypothetical protein B0H14DRAFT_3736707 [Mycena olivaceomarginata]